MRTGRPSLLVIDPSLHDPEDQGVREVIEGWPGESAVRRPGLDPRDLIGPSESHDADGIVLLGSAASVHDTSRWARDLEAWLRPVVRGEIVVPLLGVCYGHQIVAHLAGAAVGFLNEDRSRRRGIETTRFHGSRLIRGDRDLKVVVSHRETVPEAPAGFRATASRPGVPVDALEHLELPVFSVQFHPEAREERVREDGRLVLEAFRTLVLERFRAGRGAT